MTQLSRKDRARAKLERRATRGSGFSSYAKRRLIEAQNEDAMHEVSSMVEDKLGRDHAVRWLTTPHKDLEDQMPLLVLQTEEGRDQVRELLIAGKTDLPDPHDQEEEEESSG